MSREQCHIPARFGEIWLFGDLIGFAGLRYARFEGFRDSRHGGRLKWLQKVVFRCDMAILVGKAIPVERTHKAKWCGGPPEGHCWCPDWEPRLSRARPPAQSALVGSLEPLSLMLLDLWWTRNCSPNQIQWQWRFPARSHVDQSRISVSPATRPCVVESVDTSIRYFHYRYWDLWVKVKIR